MALTNKRIFFGHQSVGSNILNGIRDLASEEETIEIIETRLATVHRGSGLIHAQIGKNQDPLSKIDDFVSLINNGIGAKVDIAGFKFCYIDINRETDVGSLFKKYQDAMNELVDQFPQTRFLHITVPLRVVEPQGRLLIKRLLGKKSILMADNWKRQQFNEMMRNTFGNRQPLFDLAKAESTYPSGKRCISSMSGQKVYSLVPEYTDDGGHLNKKGQRIIAKQFIEYLQAVN